MASTTMSLQEAILTRRSIYQLTNTPPIDDAKIEAIVTDAIKHVPSSFNSQSTRLVVLLKAEHEKFWDAVAEILRVHVPDAQWEHSAKRINGFRAGYGTILFFEDPQPIKELQTKFATYAQHFPTWSEHTAAMHMYMLWLALEAEGCGCNLQHYNPLVDQRVKSQWSVPMEWDLKAQLVFGGVKEGARQGLSEKQFQPVEKRVFFHGK